MRQEPSPIPLLERQAELAALQAIIDAAAGGDGRLVVVEGSAGIGKTRLLSEARDRARSAGFEVLTARGGELETEFAFGIVRQLFEPALSAAPADVLPELLDGPARLTATLFAVVPTDADEAGAETSFAMLHGLYWLAANFALRRPTLLTVDDLHWADGSSLRWLDYLGRRLEGLPLLALVGSRPPDQASDPLLIEQIAGDAAAVIRLGGLGAASAATLVRRALGADPEQTFLAALMSASGGNPLYLAALIDTFRDEGIHPTADRAHDVLEIGPQAVSRTLSLRFARLPAEARQLVAAAAVLGDGADLGLVSALAELEPTAAARSATLLVQADILRHENPIEFVHPIVRSAVYEAMSAEERFSVHRRAAQLLLARGNPPNEPAGHLMRTMPTGDPAVPRTLLHAADWSLARGAPEAAVAYLIRALDEPPNDATRGEVLRSLGIAELHIASPAAVKHLSAARSAFDDPEKCAETALHYARALSFESRWTDAIETLSDALAQLGATRTDLHERVEAALLRAMSYEPAKYPPGSRLHSVRDQDFCGGTGTALLRAALAVDALRLGSERADAVSLARSALEGGLHHAPSDALFVAIDALVPLTLAGEVDEAAGGFDSFLETARRRGDVLTYAILLMFRGYLRTQRGDLLGAEEDLASPEMERALTVPMTESWRAGLLGDVLIDRGELDAAETILREVQPNEQPPGSLVFYHYARARLSLERHRPDDALAQLTTLAVGLATLGIENPAWVPCRSQSALTLHRLGRLDEARALAREELELSRRWGAARTIGISQRALGLVEGGRAGEQLLREASEVLATSPARLEYARTLVDLGAALRRTNHRSEARKLLREAIDLAHKCGANALSRRANEELAATGAHARTIMLSGLGSLTASERRVSQLAAQGLTNKEIAQTLFVTVKTVEVHLSRTYRKLEIDSRQQLASALAGPILETTREG